MSFLYDQTGKRKYLTIDERRAFLETASRLKPEIYTFCLTLAYTGARISEVLALTPEHINYSESAVVIECLKKRRKGVYRSIPVPMELIRLLDEVHRIKSSHCEAIELHDRIWPWCRTTAWNHVKCAMTMAGMDGARACPKGLRHGFGVSTLQKGVPINMVRKWLGHSRLSTTAIYTDAIGEEEMEIALRFWQTF